MSSDRPKRRHLLIPFGVLLAVIVIHAVYWLVVSGQIRSEADGWIDRQEAAGYVIDHQGLSVGGYPFRFSLRAAAPDIAAPEAEGGWRAQVDRLAATAQIYNLNHWILTPDGEAVFEAVTEDGPARWVAGFESARLSISGADGVTTRVGASATGLTLAAETGPAPAVEAVGALNLSGFLGEEDVFVMRLQADQLRFAEGQLDEGLEAAFGRSAELWRMEAGVTEFDALARAGDPAEWRRAGGVLDITRAQLIWGAADVSGSGQIALDADLLPTGRLSVVVTDPETLIDALVAAGLVHDEQGEALSLAALMAPRRDSGIALPFRLQDGAVFLGPARLGTFAQREAAVDAQ
jgi:hypothetical protein